MRFKKSLEFPTVDLRFEKKASKESTLHSLQSVDEIDICKEEEIGTSTAYSNPNFVEISDATHLHLGAGSILTHGKAIEKDDTFLPRRGAFWHACIKSALKILHALALFISFSACAAIFVLWKYGRDLPDYYFFLSYSPPTISRIYDRMGTPLQDLSEERRIFAHLSDIPPILIRAFISAEDKNFYNHCGIDFLGLIKAVVMNTRQRRWKTAPIGGSTITQQVAKMFVVGNEHNITRKIKEAIVAFRLEGALSKDRILELYLNKVYLGLGSYGVTVAAQTYFNKRLQDVSLAEAAFLASLPKMPTHNKNRYERARNRRNWVLQKMKYNKAISPMECDIAQKEDLPMYDYSSLHKHQTNSYYVEEARRELIRTFGEKATYNVGIEATLTIHPEIQQITEEALRYALERYDARHGWRGTIGHIDVGADWQSALEKMQINGINMSPAVVLSLSNGIEVGLSDGEKVWLTGNAFSRSAKNLKKGDVVYVRESDGTWELSQIPEVTGGMIILDAKSGEILGMSGGYSFELSQFNCATQALRQPGSTFKPFVYLTALENGFSPNSIINERPISIPIAGGFYTPHNYNKHSYGGCMPMSLGLIKSRNVLTVILANKVGMRRVSALAKKLGVADYVPEELCVALGSHETSVVRIAGAYATFFNGGNIVKPTLFLQVSSLFGCKDVAYLHQLRQSSRASELISCSPDMFNFSNEPPKASGLKKVSISQIKELLAHCVIQGTGRYLAPLEQEFPIELAGKTGTSNDFKDAWFVGAVETKTSERLGQLKPGRPLIIAVFIGYPIPRSLGQHEHGSRVALPAIAYSVRALCSERREASDHT
jgi:penicillin-binding protein 1A